MSSILSLDVCRIPVVRTRLAHAQISFVVPIPPSVIDIYPDKDNPFPRKSEKYMAWRKDAGRNVRRQGIRSFGGMVAIEVELPASPGSCDVENHLRSVFDLLQAMGIVQQKSHIADYRARRTDRTDVSVTVRAL